MSAQWPPAASHFVRGASSQPLVSLISTRWVEAFPTKTEGAQEVIKASLKEIIPQLRLPRSLESGHNPFFVPLSK